MSCAPPNPTQPREGRDRCSIPNPERSHGPYPLTHGQETLWFIEQLNPGTAAYNLAEAFVLKGTLDRSALEQSLNRLVARHETLRTFFRAEDGKPKQLVLANAHIDLDLYDLRQTSNLQSWLRMEAVRPFDLGHAPLARATLFRVAPLEHVLLINTHHIISDAWSQGVFIRELAATYDSLVTGVCSKLPELQVHGTQTSLSGNVSSWTAPSATLIWLTGARNSTRHLTRCFCLRIIAELGRGPLLG